MTFNTNTAFTFINRFIAENFLYTVRKIQQLMLYGLSCKGNLTKDEKKLF